MDDNDIQFAVKRYKKAKSEGDYTIEENGSFYNCLFKYSPGDTVEIEVYRGAETRVFTVTLAGDADTVITTQL